MGFCDLPGAGLLCDTVAGGVGDSITASIGNWIASSCGDLAQSAVDLATRGVDATTSVDLDAAWFRTNYAAILPIGLVLLVATFCLQLARAAWRRDGQALGQAVTGTVAGVLFSFTAIAFTSVALTVTDALSRGLFQLANTSVDDAVRRLVKVSLITSTSQLGWAIPALVAVGCAIGAFLYWGMMVFRKVAILILVVLAVFAGAGGGWEPAQRWRRSWIEATATLVFSKLLMTVVFLIGISAVGSSDTSQGVGALSDIIAGLVVMLLVLFCPFAVYKFVHWAGDGQAQDLHRGTAAGLGTATAMAKKGHQMAARSGGTPIPAPQGPNKVPGMTTTPPAPPADAASSPSGSATTFRFGQDPAGRRGPGDGGQPLITRPPQPRTDGDRDHALVTRPGAATAAPAGTPAPTASAPGAVPNGPVLAGARHAAAGSAPAPIDPAITPPVPQPAPQTAPTGQRWTYPGPSPRP